MSGNIVYIAAPYGGDIEDNVVRASALALHAVELGRAPLVIHPAIQAGAYGADDVPEERARGLRVAVALVRMVATVGGELWVLLTAEGGVTPGVRAEMNAYAMTGRAIRWWYLGDEGFIEVVDGDVIKAAIGLVEVAR